MYNLDGELDAVKIDHVMMMEASRSQIVNRTVRT